MKKALATTALVLALLVGVAGAATSATAVPSKQKPCSKCHALTSKITVSVTLKSQTATTATYYVKVTGGSKGAYGWAVFSGTQNIRHRLARTGTFTVNRQKTYKVRGVRKGVGSNYKTITAP